MHVSIFRYGFVFKVPTAKLDKCVCSESSSRFEKRLNVEYTIKRTYSEGSVKINALPRLGMRKALALVVSRGLSYRLVYLIYNPLSLFYISS